ncbi:hypothetical protein [Aristaeella lactis]|uniref:Uncharacterized protein n=1 Tax=Aristaeella lactis TaxID=3046383 RepID=A0AC61PLB2_9FIRM|nr:hypothetical protein [Aristaeella lactis]QUA52215.1 hypothetical protein JYE50_10870 [Aristaeella lactis]SMC59007.1 hypothetical protein SAMN06297397_1595 [Aristaeella lactis]
MEIRIAGKTGYRMNWLQAAGKKAAEIMERLAKDTEPSEEEIRACVKAELEAETAAMFRELII